MQKPIGYWLKTLDRLIDENLDRALAAEGVQRRHWQILNIVKTSPATEAKIAAALDPFWTEGAITLDEALADMTRRGWITGRERRQLTQGGEKALDAIREQTTSARRSWPASCRAIHPDRRRPGADGRQPHASLTDPPAGNPGRLPR